MRLADDDEVYEIDGSYLGPPGRFIAVMRYKAIFLWLILAPAAFWLLRTLGIPLNLMSIGLTVIGVTFGVSALADRITPERSIFDMGKSLLQEVTARRADNRSYSAHAPDLRLVGRPPGYLRRWQRRRDALAAAAGGEGREVWRSGRSSSSPVDGKDSGAGST